MGEKKRRSLATATGSVMHSVETRSSKGKRVETPMEKSNVADLKKGKLKRKTDDSEIKESEDWAMFVNPDDRLSMKAKISKHVDFKPVKAINEMLSAEKKEKFRQTCFGFLLELPEFHLQTQLIHGLLMREVKQSNHNEMWFDIAGVLLRFSIREFCVITGLKCNGSRAMCYDQAKRKDGGLYERYFSVVTKSVKLNKQTVGEVFAQNVHAASVEDAVKLSVLYVVECFLLSDQATKSVDRSTVDFIDYGDYNEYPWGKLAYGSTIGLIKNRMAAGLKRKREGDQRGWCYRLYGFPYALQVWFYECCKGAKDFFTGCVFRDGDHIPRMLSWRFVPAGKNGRDCITIMLSEDKKTLRPQKLSPSSEEMIRLGIESEEGDMSAASSSHHTSRSGANYTDRNYVLLTSQLNKLREEFENHRKMADAKLAAIISGQAAGKKYGEKTSEPAFDENEEDVTKHACNEHGIRLLPWWETEEVNEERTQRGEEAEKEGMVPERENKEKEAEGEKEANLERPSKTKGRRALQSTTLRRSSRLARL